MKSATFTCTEDPPRSTRIPSYASISVGNDAESGRPSHSPILPCPPNPLPTHFASLDMHADEARAIHRLLRCRLFPVSTARLPPLLVLRPTCDSLALRQMAGLSFLWAPFVQHNDKVMTKTPPSPPYSQHLISFHQICARTLASSNRLCVFCNKNGWNERSGKERRTKRVVLDFSCSCERVKISLVLSCRYWCSCTLTLSSLSSSSSTAAS